MKERIKILIEEYNSHKLKAFQEKIKTNCISESYNYHCAMAWQAFAELRLIGVFYVFDVIEIELEKKGEEVCKGLALFE